MLDRAGRRKFKRDMEKGKVLPMMRIPIMLFRDMNTVIGEVIIDPTKAPEGTDWGLAPGTDDEGQIVAFSTTWLKKKGTPGTTEAGEK